MSTTHAAKAAALITRTTRATAKHRVADYLLNYLTRLREVTSSDTIAHLTTRHDRSGDDTPQTLLLITRPRGETAQVLSRNGVELPDAASRTHFSSAIQRLKNKPIQTLNTLFPGAGDEEENVAALHDIILGFGSTQSDFIQYLKEVQDATTRDLGTVSSSSAVTQAQEAGYRSDSLVERWPGMKVGGLTARNDRFATMAAEQQTGGNVR